MREDDSQELRRLALFRDMQEDLFEALVRASYLQAFPPAIDLLREGDQADFLHVLIEGSVELHAAWNGAETTMAILNPVSTFILAATIADQPCLMSARTLEKTRVILLPSEDVRAIFRKDRAFADAIVVELAHCYRDMVRHAKGVKLRSALVRLANYLLQLRHEQAGDVIALTVEKRRLAAYLGMRPENLSRAFATLRDYGVSVDGAAVRLADPAALERLARPNPLIDGAACGGA